MSTKTKNQEYAEMLDKLNHGEISELLEVAWPVYKNKELVKTIVMFLQSSKIEISATMRSVMAIKATEVTAVIEGKDPLTIPIEDMQVVNAFDSMGLFNLLTDLTLLDKMEASGDKMAHSDIAKNIGKKMKAVNSSTPYPGSAATATPVVAGSAVTTLTPTTTTTTVTAKPKSTGYHRFKIPKPSVPNEKTAGIKDIDQKSWDELATILELINGQDAYNVERAALGEIAANERMALPDDYKQPTIEDSDVGLKKNPLSVDMFLKIVVANMSVLGSAGDAMLISIVRAFMVELNYYNPDIDGIPKHVSSVEIVRVKVDRSSADYAKVRDFILAPNNVNVLKDLYTLALISPIMASETFLKTGHHYISGGEYKDHYDRLFKACVCEHLKTYIEYSRLFHVAIHWVGPYTARCAWENNVKHNLIPRSMILRWNSAPAGTALVTTTSAVLFALSAMPYYADIDAAKHDDIVRIHALAKEIRRDPTKYFELSYLYGRSALTSYEKRELEEVRDLCMLMAPMSQGFLDGVAYQSDLGKAKVLIKYANMQSGIREIYKKWFRAANNSMGSKTSLKDIMSLSVANPASV